MRLATLFLLSAATLLQTVLASQHQSDTTLHKRFSANGTLLGQAQADAASLAGDVDQLEGLVFNSAAALSTLTALANLAGLTPSNNNDSSQTQDDGDLQTPGLDAVREAIRSALSILVSNSAEMGTMMNFTLNDLNIFHDDMTAAGFNIPDVVDPNDPGSFSR